MAARSGRKVLLINPPMQSLYLGTTVRSGVPSSPVLSLASLAASLLEHHFEVLIFDANLASEPVKEYTELLRRARPDIVGVTASTAVFPAAQEIAAETRKLLPRSRLVIGGPHASALPARTLEESQFDVAVEGEADLTVAQVMSEEDPSRIPGVFFKRDGAIQAGLRRRQVDDLDGLPFPAWHLTEVHRYQSGKVFSRQSPVGYLETSRGCPYACVFCNKKIFGQGFRVKSVQRTVDEMQHMLGHGFHEIHIVDDVFTQDQERAIGICEEILRRGLRFPWMLQNGVRVDQMSRKLAQLLHHAGCYRAGIGIETGDQHLLECIGKRQDLGRVRETVRLLKEAGVETVGYFVIGLPGETRETLQKTIDFAVELKLDLAKLAIMIPLPGSRVFEEFEKAGLLDGRNWFDYNFYHPDRPVPIHPDSDITEEDLKRAYQQFYRRFYLRPSYIISKALRALQQGSFLSHVRSFLQTRW